MQYRLNMYVNEMTELDLTVKDLDDSFLYISKGNSTY